MKGLLIGRNPINTITGNGKTLAAFFGNFSSNQLTQVFVSDIFADEQLCHSFYKINEKKLLFGDREGLIIRYNQVQSDSKSNQNKIKSIKKYIVSFLRSKLGIVIRNLAWKRNEAFLRDEITNIIRKEKIDFLFYDIGNLSAEYSLVTQIATEVSLPLFLYVSDDYIYGKNGRKSSKKTRKIFENLVALSSATIVISDAMKSLYEEHIKTDYLVAMNGCDSALRLSKKTEPFGKKLVYTGNIGIGRFEVLQVLDEVIALNDDDSSMEVYSSFEIASDKRERIERNGKTRLCGSVFGDELKKAWEDADVLVHVESFDKKYRTILETAISTKISEYMYAERPILIVAPPYSESARFVERYEAGTVVYTDDVSSIATVLKELWENYAALLKKASKARIFAEENLSKEAVAKRVFERISHYCYIDEKEEK